jgi:hypothetical protein
MALTGQEAPNISSQGGSAWAFDDAIGELVPLAGAAPADLIRSIGQGSGLLPYRFLVNRLLPGGLFAWTSAVGTAVVAASETTLLTGATFLGPKYTGVTAGTFPAGFLNIVGRKISFFAFGTMASTGSTPTNNIKFKLGTNIVIATGAQTTVSVTGTLPWGFRGEATVITSGSSGTILGQGEFYYYSTAPVRVTWSAYNSGAVTLDLTSALAIDLTSTWSSVTGAPTMLCQGLSVRVDA